MEKFITHTGIGVPLRRSNVDTDQIIPAVYLKRVTRTGFEDALFAACRICAHLGMTGERLHGLAGKIPRFVLRRREVSLRSGQGEVLSVLLRTLPGAQPAGGGLRVRQGEGWVTLVPLARSAVLRIVGEARSAELAEELCAFCARRAEEADRGLPEK